MKRLAVFNVLVALALLLAACAPAAAPTTPAADENPPAAENPTARPVEEEPSTSDGSAAEPVVIRTTFSEGELTDEMIAEFEAEHPNIKVQRESVDDTKLAAMIATDSVPDVLRINGVFDLPKYVTQGLALDLTDYFETSELIKLDDLLPVANVYRFDGSTVGQGPIYGLPKDWSNDYALWYNKRAFEAAGVELPSDTEALTWQEVFDLAERLTIKEGDTIVQYGLAATEWGKTEPNFNIMAQYLASAGASLYSEDFRTANFDIPAVHDFLTLWVDGVKNNVGPNSINGDQTSGGDLFKSDQCALLIDGYWWSGSLRGDENTNSHLEDFGMLPTPKAENGIWSAATGSATGAIIFSRSQHPDEAFTFFEWFLAGKPADDRATSGWGLPAFESKMELIPQDTVFDQQVYNVLLRELENQGGFLKINPYFADTWGTFEKYAAPLYFDQSTIDEAMAGMTKDANNLIQETLSALE